LDSEIIEEGAGEVEAGVAGVEEEHGGDHGAMVRAVRGTLS